MILRRRVGVLAKLESSSGADNCQDAIPRCGSQTVIDKTGLDGTYDIGVEWSSDDTPPLDRSGPSIFTAIQEQLGLKLESQKAPVEMLIIDHAEKPSGN